MQQRRSQVRRRLVGLALLMGFAATACAPEIGKRPNVVLIVTDDQAFSTLAHMPIVQRELVRKGTTLPNFILNDPICCPSRVTILLGQYRHNHQLEFGWPGGCAFRFFEDQSPERTVGALIHGAGYRTSMLGKYLNSYNDYYRRRIGMQGNPLLTGWDDYHVLAHKHPRYFDFYMHENGELIHHNERPAVYQTDLLAQQANAFIRASTGEQQPFFLYVAPLAPHDPSTPALRHRKTFKGTKAPRPPSFNPADVAGQPSLAATTALDNQAIKAVDLRYRAHLETLQAVDEMVGLIVATLEATGQLDNTYIFYTSDNGHHFGEHRIADGKATAFEESIRFPLLVRGPGIRADVSLPQLASNVDLHPTLLDVIGAPLDPKVDGRSLLPLLRQAEPPANWRKSLVIESVTPQPGGRPPPFVGLRTSRFKLVSYEGGARELYDLRLDPYETRNVIDATDASVVAELTERMNELLHCGGDSCREIESRGFPQAEPNLP